LLITLIPRRGLLALNRHDGTIAWERPAAVEYYYAAPVLTGELLVSGGDAESLLVLQARTGEIVWHQPVLSARCPTGLAADESRIYATTSEGEAHGYDLHSGRRLWSFQSGEDLLDMTPYRRGIRSLLAAPTLLGGQVLVGGCDGQLSLLDRSTGAIRGQFSFDAPITAAVCLTGEGFCVGTYDGRLACFAA
jgi:outer membrane protein assembly factor BamB